MPMLGRPAKADDKTYIPEMRQEFRPPGRRTFRTGRQIGTLCILAGKAEPHGHDGNMALIIKQGLVDAEPLPQPDARRVGKGPARGVYAGPRRLSDDQEPRR